MSYKRKTKTAYSRAAQVRYRSRLWLLPEAHEHLAAITAAMESIGSLAPSRNLAVSMGLELLAQQAKRSPAAVAKRIRALSVSPARVEAGVSKLPDGVPVVEPAVKPVMALRLLDSLRLTDPPSDPAETCGFPPVEGTTVAPPSNGQA
jgi:hypothetical protein